MRKIRGALSLLFLVIIAGCAAQSGVNKNTKSKIEIVMPSLNAEATSIWKTINDIAFFEQQGYTIHLPKDPVIDSLILKSKKGTFGNQDFATIFELLEHKFFSPNHYLEAQKKVEAQLDLLLGFLNQIASDKSTWDWNFKSFDVYKVVFTLYGTGGSYDPEQGVVTLLTNKKGDFAKYKNPAYTIIHEIAHMGMEDSIVHAFQLSHGSKERVVDTFVSLLFKEKLPKYQIQKMGDDRIEQQVNAKEKIASLSAIMQSIVRGK